MNTLRRTITQLLSAAVVATVLVAAPLATSSASAAACPASAGQRLNATPATTPRTVALTFDDGPTAATPAILDALAARGVRATFFVTGPNVAARPDIARRIVADGHVIANHTWSHPQAVAGSVPFGRFDSLPAAEQESQIDRTTGAIQAATGVRPCFFRGPGGWHNTATTAAITRARGLTIAHWTLASGDSAQAPTTTAASTQAIVSASVSTHAHPIVLLHDGKASPEPEGQVTSNRSNTVAALPAIIDSYKSKGYTFTDPAGRALETGNPHVRRNPVGALDAVNGGGSSVRLRGWAFDPDATQSTVDVHVYLSGRGLGGGATGVPRPDVAATFRVGPNQGYDFTLPAAPGSYTACVYAINIGRGTTNPSIGCRTVTVASSDPIGALDGVAAGGGMVRAFGWTFDADTTAPLGVHVYVDGRYAGQGATGVARPDVARVYAAAGPASGYDVSVPAAPGPHRVCAYAINSGAGTTNPSIGCRTVTVAS